MPLLYPEPFSYPLLDRNAITKLCAWFDTNPVNPKTGAPIKAITERISVHSLEEHIQGPHLLDSDARLCYREHQTPIAFDDAGMRLVHRDDQENLEGFAHLHLALANSGTTNDLEVGEYDLYGSILGVSYLLIHTRDASLLMIDEQVDIDGLPEEASCPFNIFSVFPHSIDLSGHEKMQRAARIDDFNTLVQMFWKDSDLIPGNDIKIGYITL